MTTQTIAISSPRRPAIALPLVLITIGVALLLVNAGYLRAVTWSDLAPLWPVLLVLGGVDLLLRSRSFAAAALVEVAIVVATLVYIVNGVTPVATATTHESVLARAGITDLDLSVNYGAGAFTLVGSGTDLMSVRSSREDIERRIDQSGSHAAAVISSKADTIFPFGGDRRWDTTLSSDVRTSATFNLGAGDFNIDLSSVQIVRATINAGACDLTVKMPKPSGDVPIVISTGASSVQILIPAGVAYRVEDTGALHSVTGIKESVGYSTASDRLTIRISAAMSSVTIR